MVDTVRHRSVMAVATTILFLRKHGREDLAKQLSLVAIEEGIPEVLVAVPWNEPA